MKNLKLGKLIDVLDHGSITLLDVMGTDLDIVNAARVSYASNKLKKAPNKQETRKLIRYLIRQGHLSPFEMAEMKFHVKAPIFVFRQWHRHRTANISEISGRYSKLETEFYRPEVFRKNDGGVIGYNIDDSYELTSLDYEGMLHEEIVREQARMVLPVSTYTEMIWKCDLRNIMNFLLQRLDTNAQFEIRVYAKVIAEFVKKYFPYTWEAFNDYIFESLSISGPELVILNEYLSGDNKVKDRIRYELSVGQGRFKNFGKSERSAFSGKLKQLGIN
jgi:thymidylate synthase (FAD)